MYDYTICGYFLRYNGTYFQNKFLENYKLDTYLLFQTVNKDGLIYVDLDLKDTPSTSTEAFVIHGADDRTQYVDIDFTKRADPPRDTDNEKSQNEKEKKKA